VFERYSIASRRAVFSARVEAGLLGSEIIDSEHLLLGLMRVDPTTLQLIAPPVTLDRIREAASRWHAPREKLPTSLDLPFSEDIGSALKNAKSFAVSGGFSYVRTEHLIYALMTLTTSHAAVILEEADASLSRLEQLVVSIQVAANQEGVWNDPTFLMDL
jgi:ATP-dependent Clp protease ATP-binding subunit ClpA